ncbi:MAG: hypothetical protein ACRYGI_09150 [Janthinobacterium lividum]
MRIEHGQADTAGVSSDADGPVVVYGDYTATRGVPVWVEVDSRLDPSGGFFPVDATLDIRATKQQARIDDYALGKVKILGGVGGTIDVQVPDTRDSTSIDIEDGGHTAWAITMDGNSGGIFTLGSGPHDISATGFAASFSGSSGYQDLSVDLYAATVHLGGSHNLIQVGDQNSYLNGSEFQNFLEVVTPGSFNTIVNLGDPQQFANTSGASITSGAYSTVSGFDDATINVGAKSFLSGSFTNVTITAGAQTVIGDLYESSVTSGAKSTFGIISETGMTLERDCSIQKLDNYSFVDTANGLTVGTFGGDSQIKGAGIVSIVDAVQGRYDAGTSSNLVSAQKVFAQFGDADRNASAAFAATSRGSLVTGGQGTQVATNIGPSGMTFISAASNAGGVFTAVGDGDHDTFVAHSAMTMTGGTGASNLFDIVAGVSARDLVTDFAAAAGNRIKLDGFNLTESGLSNILAHATGSTAGLVLHVDSGTTLTLAGVAPGHIGNASFILG